MDFQSLSRRELQALCKKNKIPANMTNVAMADALAALTHVEGLEELGNNLCETPLRQTAAKTTTRRKPAMEQEPEGSIQSTRTRTRRVISKAVSEKTDEEENVNINSLQTPAAPTTRRRAPAASTRTKLATEKVDKKKAPAAATGQSAYSTRRSTRLLEKTMADLTLTDEQISEPNAIDEEAPKEVNRTEKEAFKPIKMEELHAKSDMSTGVPDVDEENKDIEDVNSSVIPETESKREVVDVPDLEEATKEETLDNGAEENKDIEDVKSSVIPETESKREVVDVPHLDEATKEETSDNGAEQNKDDTNVSDVVDDAIITAVEGVERDLGSGEELLVEADDSKPSHDKLVEEEETEMKDEEVETEEGEKSFPDAEEVEEAADLEVTDNQTIVAVENASEEDDEGEKSLPNAEEVEEEEAVDDQTIVAPECVNVIAAENANYEDEEGEKSLSDEEEAEEAADLEVVMDDQTVAAPDCSNVVIDENANEEHEEGEKSLSDEEEVEEEAAALEVVDDQTVVALECSNVIDAENANEEVEEVEEEEEEVDDLEVVDENAVADENANKEDEAIQLPTVFTAATSVSTPPPVTSVKKMKEKESGKEELLLQVYADPAESVAANNTTPAAPASVQKMRILSPFSAPTLKSSSKKNQSALVDVNKENNQIHQSGRQVVEPLAATAGNNANAVEVVIPKKKKKKCLEEESLRKLTKMLKEQLVLNNKEDGDEACPANLPTKKQQQVEQMVGKKYPRQALQKLPENVQAVEDAE